MAMFGNGVPIGMAITQPQRKPILQALQQVRTACFVAAAGTAVPRVAVRPFAATPTRTTTTAGSGSGWLSSRSSNELKVEREKLKEVPNRTLVRILKNPVTIATDFNPGIKNEERETNDLMFRYWEKIKHRTLVRI